MSVHLINSEENKIKYKEENKNPLDYFSVLSKEGTDIAIYNLGLKLIEKNDLESAIKLFEYSSNKRNGWALNHLASMTFNGEGCEKDEKKGFELLLVAEKMGNVNAMINLARIYCDQQNYVLHFSFFIIFLCFFFVFVIFFILNYFCFYYYLK